MVLTMCLLARSGTATWYFHYDAELGKRRERRKLKIGRLMKSPWRGRLARQSGCGR